MTTAGHTRLLTACRDPHRLLPIMLISIYGEAHGGPPPTVRSLSRYSMLRMSLAPCAPFNVTTELMVKAARLARQYPGVRLHTHLAENQEDLDFSQSTYGCRPGQYIK